MAPSGRNEAHAIVASKPDPTDEPIAASQSHPLKRAREMTGFVFDLAKVLPRYLDNPSIPWYTETVVQSSKMMAGPQRLPDCQPPTQSRIEGGM
jgi:hypothetical protein